MTEFWVTGATSAQHAELAVWRYIEREQDFEWIEELQDKWKVKVAFYGYSRALRVRVVPS